MPLEDLVARLEREAQARADAAGESARAEAAKIDQQSLAASSRERTEVLAERRTKRRARLNRELADARARLRAAELTARQSLIERVFARATQLFDTPEGQAAFATELPRLLSQALPYFGGGAVRARCRPELMPALSAAGVEASGDWAAPAGVVLTSADGACAIDLGLHARLERRRAQLTLELSQELGP